jgi:hypothetical protein
MISTARSLNASPPGGRRPSLGGFAVVLHACNAPAELLAGVRELAGAGFAGIVVVDGSAPGCEIGEVAQIAGVLVCSMATIRVRTRGPAQSALRQAI